MAHGDDLDALIVKYTGLGYGVVFTAARIVWAVRPGGYWKVFTGPERWIGDHHRNARRWAEEE